MKTAAAAAELTIAHLRFVGPMGIAKTSSGKTGYGQLRREFGALPACIRHRAMSAEARDPGNHSVQHREHNDERENAQPAMVR